MVSTNHDSALKIIPDVATLNVPTLVESFLSHRQNHQRAVKP